MPGSCNTRISHQTLGKGVINLELSVDRLSLVGFKNSYKLDNFLSDINTDIIDKRVRANYPYEWRYILVGGGVLEIGELEEQSNIRLDFNPNSVKLDRHREQLERLISCMKYVKPTRIDIAIDIKNIDLNDYIVIDNMSRKNNRYYDGKNRLETYYLGARNSDFTIRMYDKALEQGKDGDWWRIEAQLRREFAENYKNINPFESFVLVEKKSNLDHIKGFSQKMIVKHLLNEPDDLMLASDNTRYKYKKILKDLAGSNSTQKKLFDFYDKKKTIVVDTYYNYVKHSFKNDLA